MTDEEEYSQLARQLDDEMFRRLREAIDEAAEAARKAEQEEGQ